MYAEIAVDAPVHATFDYLVPPELADRLTLGHLVQIPFGTAAQHGIILRLHDTPPAQTAKPITALLDPRPILTPGQIAVSRWIASTYLAPLGPCLWLWLPPGLTGQRDVRVTRIPGATSPDRLSALETTLLDLLERRGPLRGTQLNAALPGQDWRTAVDGLARAGLVSKESIIAPPRQKPRIVQTAALAIPPEQIGRAVRALEKPSRRAALLAAVARAAEPLPLRDALRAAGATRDHVQKLADAGLIRIEDDRLVLAIPPREVDQRLAELRRVDKPLRILRMLAREAEPVDVSWVYAQADATLADLRRLEEAGLIALGEAQKWRDPLADREFIAMSPPRLTGEQAAAWETIKAAIQRGQGAQFLLHGVTGSGKTEIYLRAIQLTLALERSAIFLVPEIALTPQTINRVAARFPGQVGVVHSGLSEGERYDTWRKARDGLIRVVVGARSALFTPLPDVGLIILDEEHDPSYKNGAMPAYHARAVAEMMMGLNGGVVVLGSATPDLETFYRSEGGVVTGASPITRLTLPNRIVGHREHIRQQTERVSAGRDLAGGTRIRYQPDNASEDALITGLPPVQIVDMREELKRGNTSMFSIALQHALAETLTRREQAILFLNRRGQNTFIFCRDCGHVEKCPRCATPLTYHRAGELRCHRCGYVSQPPARCPACGSARIKYFGAGTQQVEDTVIQFFPKARVVRWDADSASSPGAHEAILERFIQRKADVMVGTQMVAKGLDLPLVTLVGVVSADTALALPDFRAEERTFQLLTQVAGRAGRGLLGGQVILQTYQPDSDALQMAARHDYAGFYARALARRRDLGYPPFRRLVRLVFRFPTERKAEAEARRAEALLRARLAQLQMTATEIIGPAPCYFTRENDSFRWHLLLRGPDPTRAFSGIDLPRGWHIDVDPVDVL
jgi:primosomal protein N' (replication factor Y)